MNTPTNHTGKKILFACAPADGHFNPLTGLAKHLQQLGYDVRWYAPSRYATKLNKLQIPAYLYKKAMDVTADEIDTVFPERNKIRNPISKLNFDMEYFFIRRGPEYYLDIREIFQEFPFDMMLCDVAFTGSVFVKELLQVPVVAIGVFPLIESSRDLPPNGLGMVPAPGLLGRWKHRILHYIVKNILFRKPNKLMHRILEDHGILHDNLFLFDILSRKADYILQSGTPGFEYHRSDLSTNIRYIGSLLPYKSGVQKEAWFDERLNQYDRAVLVTQGTVERDINKLLVPTLEAFKQTGTLVICTTGGSQTAELKKRYPYQNIIIEDFIPFDEVMPYCDAYITNGGYGGVMLGIENKLPLVVAGVHEGKNEICARVGYFKYGINLKTEKPSVKKIRQAVEEVISNDIYKNNIIRLSEEFSQYNPNDLCAQYTGELTKSKSTVHLLKAIETSVQ